MEPNIISVSRREDIPAFRGDWFMDRLKEGYVTLNNPFSGKDYQINFDKTYFAVFWTKNPKPFMKHLNELPFNYYFQYTLNDYPEYELNVPPLDERIKTFKELSDEIGAEKVIWRFDPIIINDTINEDEILKRIQNIGDQLIEYTYKLVFSFIDPYKKLGNKFQEIDVDTKISIAKKLVELNKKWNFTISTCAEAIDLEGIEHNRCIDPVLIDQIGHGSGRWNSGKKDKSQRAACGCAASSDIGTFRTCRHRCDYCYAK